jgi:hypothetical protein
VKQNSVDFPAEFCPDRTTTVCTFGGTSAAAPTVSGVIALMLLANADLSPEAIAEILRSTADKGDLKLDALGINLPSTEFRTERVYGSSGLLNACLAVEEALKRAVSPEGIPKRTDGSRYCND